MHTPDGTWNVNNNFPKLASSAAHLFGKPKVWTEEGGGPGIDGKYQLDFQLVRGVNALQIRVPVGAERSGGIAAGPTPPCRRRRPCWRGTPTGRGYLMAIGRPAAQVGLYHPANSMWMGDEEADRSTTKLGWQLLNTRWIGITSTSSRSARWRPSRTAASRTSAGRCTGPSWFRPRR